MLSSCGEEQDKTYTIGLTNRQDRFYSILGQLTNELNDRLSSCLTFEIPFIPEVKFASIGAGAYYFRPGLIYINENDPSGYASYYAHEYVRHILYHNGSDRWNLPSAGEHNGWGLQPTKCMWNIAETLSLKYN